MPYLVKNPHSIQLPPIYTTNRRTLYKTSFYTHTLNIQLKNALLSQNPLIQNSKTQSFYTQKPNFRQLKNVLLSQKPNHSPIYN
jgi:hypothetical protein